MLLLLNVFLKPPIIVLGMVGGGDLFTKCFSFIKLAHCLLMCLIHTVSPVQSFYDYTTILCACHIWILARKFVASSVS